MSSSTIPCEERYFFSCSKRSMICTSHFPVDRATAMHVWRNDSSGRASFVARAALKCAFTLQGSRKRQRSAKLCDSESRCNFKQHRLQLFHIFSWKSFWLTLKLMQILLFWNFHKFYTWQFRDKTCTRVKMLKLSFQRVCVCGAYFHSEWPLKRGNASNFFKGIEVLMTCGVDFTGKT